MTVKFSSVHIKWKSLLTFPQTEQVRESRRRAGEQKCVKGEFRCRKSARESKCKQPDGAQVRGSLSQNWKLREANVDSTYIGSTWILSAHYKTSQREQRRRFKVLQVWLCSVWTSGTSSDWQQRASHRISTLLPLFTYSVQLNGLHMQFLTTLLLKNMLRWWAHFQHYSTSAATVVKSSWGWFDPPKGDASVCTCRGTHHWVAQLSHDFH